MVNEASVLGKKRINFADELMQEVKCQRAKVAVIAIVGVWIVNIEHFALLWLVWFTAGSTEVELVYK